MLKKPTMKQKGLKKLPEEVRNKMGFMDKGGFVKSFAKGATDSITDFPDDLKKTVSRLTKSNKSLSETSKARRDMLIDEKQISKKEAKDLNSNAAINKKFKEYLEKGQKPFFKSSEEFIKNRQKKQDGGRVGAADMSAKKTSSPKKKQMPKYYMGGGAVKQGKMYSYGGRVAKYKD